MAGKILVTLKRHDRIEEIIPYVEKVAQPGMRVVFLIRSQVDGLEYLLDYVATMQTGLQKTLAAMKMAKRYSLLEAERQLVKQKVFPPREALHKRGVEVAVDVCTGHLKKVVRSYTLNGDVHLIMQRAGNGHPLVNLLRWTTDPSGLFKRHTLSPVLLLHPDQT